MSPPCAGWTPCSPLARETTVSTLSWEGQPVSPLVGDIVLTLSGKDTVFTLSGRDNGVHAVGGRQPCSPPRGRNNRLHPLGRHCVRPLGEREPCSPSRGRHCVHPVGEREPCSPSRGRHCVHPVGEREPCSPSIVGDTVFTRSGRENRVHRLSWGGQRVHPLGPGVFPLSGRDNGVHPVGGRQPCSPSWGETTVFTPMVTSSLERVVPVKRSGRSLERSTI